VAPVLQFLLAFILLLGHIGIAQGRADSAHATDKCPEELKRQLKAGEECQPHHLHLGANLELIAKIYHVTTDQIREWNGLQPDEALADRSVVWVIWSKRPGGHYERHSVRRTKRSTRSIEQGRRDTQSWYKSKGSHTNGKLLGGRQIPTGRGYVVRNPKESWGTPKTIALIQRAIHCAHAKSADLPPVVVGDISLQNGGKFGGHRSHQNGLDVDIGYVAKDRSLDGNFFRGTPETMDTERSLDVLQCFLDTGQVTHMFIDYDVQKLLYQAAKKRKMSKKDRRELFQFPRGKDAWARIRHSKGHKNHFHVRFRKPDEELALQSR